MKLALLFIATFSAATFSTQAQTPGPTTRATVQATGSASISVTPDQAQISVSAVTTAATAQDAGSQNASVAFNIISQLTQLLGSSGTVQTVSYSVNPNYNNSQVLTGYTVTNTIQVVLNDLTIAGKVIDTATQAGASRINSLQFTLKDDSSARSQALSAATLKAKAKADAMATSVGLHTGAFLVIQESGAVVQSILTAGSPTATTTPIQPGNLNVTGNVTISVELVN